MTSSVFYFPLIRHLSSWLSPHLIRLPVSANQVTAASLVTGLIACWLLTLPDQVWHLASAAFLIVCYVLDNCDGEVARAKDQCSVFGEKFDSFVDWIVHAALFAALGLGVARETGDALWLWLGLIAAAGGTINYGVGIYLDIRHGPADDGHGPVLPIGAAQWGVFIFRELLRADFCFILLALALVDSAWALLPVGAIGAQLFWMTQFIQGAREYHV